MLDEIKSALRIKNNRNDDDIQRNIDACLADLARVGVDVANPESPMIFALVVEYMKAIYNIANEGERYWKNYERRRDSVSMCGDYKEKAHEA